MKKIIYMICFLLVPVSLSAQNFASSFESIREIADDSTYAALTQSAGDSVNISQMVQSQIDDARQKEIVEKNKPAAHEPVKIERNSVAASPSFLTGLRKEIPLSDDLMMKLSILGTAAILAAGIVVTRRSRGKKKSDKGNLKNNIKLLREEKIFGKTGGKLSAVRSKLAKEPSTYELSEKAIARNARERNISQGEIYLAAKIKSHEMNKVGRVRN